MYVYFIRKDWFFLCRMKGAATEKMGYVCVLSLVVYLVLSAAEVNLWRKFRFVFFSRYSERKKNHRFFSSSHIASRRNPFAVHQSRVKRLLCLPKIDSRSRKQKSCKQTKFYISVICVSVCAKIYFLWKLCVWYLHATTKISRSINEWISFYFSLLTVWHSNKLARSNVMSLAFPLMYLT